MPPVIDKQSKLSFTPSDFDPPLKRKKPTLPGYWTIEELADELDLGTRRITYDITGYPVKKIQPTLKAYKAGSAFFIPDSDALEYIQVVRKRRSCKKS